MASSSPQSREVSLRGPAAFALGAALRAVAVGALALAVIYLVAATHLYMTAVVLTGLAGLVVLDLMREVGRADRQLAEFVDGLAAESFDRPWRGAAGFAALTAAMDSAATGLQARRLERQRRIETLQTLADSVVACLVVIDADGQAAPANRAAHRLVGEAISALSEAPAIGPEAARRIEALSPGAREIVRLVDGRQMLASAVQFSVPGGVPQRLISLQDVALELDAVELKAWQDLVRILAHEMMNSLTPISSLAESLQGLVQPTAGGKKPRPNDDIASAVEVIARRSRGLMSFVDSYRKVADIPPPILEPLPLAAFVAGIDRLMSATLQARGVVYRSSVQPADLTVRADATLLEQAIINLLTNAVDAVGEAAAPNITLTCRLTEDGAAITVADNGPGLSEEVKDKLFVPFFTTKPAGSGIGLSIARQIALAHHGSLEARQRAAGGAAFVLTLPVVG